MTALFSRESYVNGCFFVRIEGCNTLFCIDSHIYFCIGSVALSYSTWITWMHKFKDICLQLSHICLEFHLFHPVFYFPNNLPPSFSLPAVIYFIVPWNPFISRADGGEQCRPHTPLLYKGILQHGEQALCLVWVFLLRTQLVPSTRQCGWPWLQSSGRAWLAGFPVR